MGMKRRLLLNTITPLALQIATFVSGFIIPQLIISSYGSSTNGLVQSVTQFLSVINFFEAGVGSVVSYNLFKPLSDHDSYQLSCVMTSATKFFHNLIKIFLCYAFLLVLLFPSLSKSQFGYLQTVELVLAVAAGALSQYYFSQVNQILLTADQRGYIHCIISIAVILLNTLSCVLLIKNKFSIIFVKFVSAMVFVIRPVFLCWYVRKHYAIDYKVKYSGEPIKQKWNGFAHHLASFVFGNTDIIVLTFFSSFQNVSVYSVYALIVTGLNTLFASLLSGVGAVFGDLYAKNDREKLRTVFQKTEWISHNCCVILFTDTALLIVDFVLIYTKKASDAEYEQPLFATLLVIAYGLCCLRNVYNVLICSTGHLKETQISSFAEAGINIVLSLLLVNYYGLVGVAIGTLVAVLYQLVYYIDFTYKRIMNLGKFVIRKQIAIDGIAVVLIVFFSRTIKLIEYTYSAWFFKGFIVFAISVLCVVGINLVFCRKQIRELLTLFHT